MVHRTFHLRNALNISEFGLRANDILVAAPAQSTENIPRFLLATDLDKPSGRLGKEPHDREEQNEEYDLEGDGESPAEGGIAVVDEGKATARC